MIDIPLTFFEGSACHVVRSWTFIWSRKLVGSKGMSDWGKDMKVSKMSSKLMGEENGFKEINNNMVFRKPKA